MGPGEFIFTFVWAIRLTAFCSQADPINGFVPETMDFARMVEADEQAFAAPATGGVATPGGGDPALHALHAKLRVDYRAWEESPIDVLKEHGEFIFIYAYAQLD